MVFGLLRGRRTGVLRDQLRDYELEHGCRYADVHGRHQARDLRFSPGRKWGAIA